MTYRSGHVFASPQRWDRISIKRSLHGTLNVRNECTMPSMAQDNNSGTPTESEAVMTWRRKWLQKLSTRQSKTIAVMMKITKTGGDRDRSDTPAKETSMDVDQCRSVPLRPGTTICVACPVIWYGGIHNMLGRTKSLETANGQCRIVDLLRTPGDASCLVIGFAQVRR